VSGKKVNHFMLLKKTIAVYTESRLHHITHCVEDTEVLDVRIYLTLQFESVESRNGVRENISGDILCLSAVQRKFL
jgi:hypothetical protein